MLQLQQPQLFSFQINITYFQTMLSFSNAIHLSHNISLSLCDSKPRAQFVWQVNCWPSVIILTWWPPEPAASQNPFAATSLQNVGCEASATTAFCRCEKRFAHAVTAHELYCNAHCDWIRRCAFVCWDMHVWATHIPCCIWPKPLLCSTALYKSWSK